MSLSLGELAVRFGCELRGDPDTHVERVAPLANADERSIAFLANPRYRAQLAATRAGAVVLNAASADECPTAVLLCDNPYATFARIATILHPLPQLEPGVHPSAVVAASARIDPSAQVGAYAIVGANVVVGARAFIGPHCCLEEGVTLAADVRLVARVTLCRAVQIGTRAVLQPGVVIGGDGFGFAPERGTWLKVPQLGTVRIGADVEIGANTTIDRGAIDDTLIGDGVKIDNQVQIGHNCVVGDHTVISAFCGLSGSTRIGRRCMVGGSVGFVGHQTICDDVAFTGDCMVSGDIDQPGVYSGSIPATPQREWQRLVARFRRLDALALQVRRLAKKLGEETGND
jgi:UDP-3-O-[3-hydroxymyristoyl] glucosamine N-acyltransferase